jgi:uncharacterized membrane protein (DUF373 family)
MEIILSIMLLIGLGYSAIQIIVNSIIGQNLHYQNILPDILQVIVGIEFIKMLAKHTAGSAIDVLIFAVSRKIIIAHYTATDLILAIVSMAILFAIRMYFNYSHK